jgi:tetratricopeptide (TPR) repeat protein
MSDLLQRGIALARSGKRAEARAVLLEVVDADERDEQAWLWLSGVVDDPDDVRVCLENVLAVNPEHTQARQGLEWLNARYGMPVVPPLEPTEVQSTLPSEDDRDDQLVEAPTEAALADPLAAPMISASDADNPCPYCGAATTASQRDCTRCRRSLMIRDDPREQRSIWLTLLAMLFFAYGVLAIGAALFPIANDVAQRTLAFAADPNAPGQTQELQMLPIAVGGVAGLIYLALGALLLRRERIAYGAAAMMQALSAAAAIIFLARTPSDAFGGGSLLFLLGVLVGLLGVLIPAGLFALSYRDFVGGQSRFKPSFPHSDHATHYNNGVSYKDRGMWYMAMREWELAVSRAPFDLNYLHALGLSYAQVGRHDRARTTLDRALQIAPGHRQISESRALVDRMAQETQS